MTCTLESKIVQGSPAECRNCHVHWQGAPATPAAFNADVSSGKADHPESPAGEKPTRVGGKSGSNGTDPSADDDRAWISTPRNSPGAAANRARTNAIGGSRSRI